MWYHKTWAFIFGFCITNKGGLGVSHSFLEPWREKFLEKITYIKMGRLYLFSYFHCILDILIHMVSDFNLFYIQDMRIRKMGDFFLLLALLSSTVWKWTKWPLDLFSMIGEGSVKGSNIRRVTFLETLVTPIWEPLILIFMVCSLLFHFAVDSLWKYFNWKMLGLISFWDVYFQTGKI